MVEIALKCHLPKTGVSSSSSTRTRPLRNCPGKKRRDEFSKRIRNLSSLRPPCGGAMEPTSLKRDMSTAPPLTAAVLPPLLVVRSVTLLLPLPCCNAGKRRKVYRLSPVFDELMRIIATISSSSSSSAFNNKLLPFHSQTGRRVLINR